MDLQTEYQFLLLEFCWAGLRKIKKSLLTDLFGVLLCAGVDG